MFGFLKRKTSVPPPPDTFFANYTLLDKLGEGGYGEVYICQTKQTCTLHAVKIVHDKMYRRKSWCARRDMFLPDEILLWEKANHRSIVQLCDLYIEQDFWFAVMEYDPEYVDLYTACPVLYILHTLYMIINIIYNVCNI